MGFQALGLDSRYQSDVEVNNNQQASYQQEEPSTYDIAITPTASIGSSSDSWSVYANSRNYLYRDPVGHFTVDLTIDWEALLQPDKEFQLYVNDNKEVDVTNTGVTENSYSGTVDKNGIQLTTISVDGIDGNADGTNNIDYLDPVSASFSVDSVTKE